MLLERFNVDDTFSCDDVSKTLQNLDNISMSLPLTLELTL